MKSEANNPTRKLALPRGLSKKNATIFVIVFAVVGSTLLIRSFAASPLASLQPESSSLSGSVTVGDDPNASGGKYIQFGGGSVGGTTTPPSGGTAYYVDCAGNDSNSGLSATAAWKTLAKANQASLKPGESLLLKRGCSWNEQLTAKWTGTSASPILISAYGSGADPLIQQNAGTTSGTEVNVLINGSYQVVSHIQSAVTNPVRNTACLQSDGSGVPLGWYVGFSLNGSYNTLQNLDAHGLSVGISMGDGASHNRLLDSHFHELHSLWDINKSSGALGSIGINLHGNDNEVANNLFENNGTACTYADDGTQQQYSAPIEVYNANRNYVHHNIAYGHRKHFELGHDSTHTTDDNVLAYNLFVSDFPAAVGVNIHGATNPFGPVNRTQIYHNTIVFTGANSQAVVCSCSGGATLEDNILVSEGKAAYYSGTVAEKNNIYWDFTKTADATADPFVQFSGASQTSINATSKLADPNFVNSNSDYHLQSSSLGINKAQAINTIDTSLLAILGKDLDNKVVPQSGAPDIGVYEQ